MEQLELFESSHSDSEQEMPEVDYIFVPENGKYRLVHSFYNTSKLGELLSAEAVLESLVFHNNWYLCSTVSFQDWKGLKRRSR